MYCRHCAKEVVPNAEICVGCGMRPLSDDKFCQSCGAETHAQQEVCIKCGVRLVGSSGRKILASGVTKSVTAAWVVSCLIPGLGQIYLGQIVKGFTLMFVGFLMLISTGGYGGVVMWVVALVDTVKIANKLEQGKTVGEWEFF